MDPESDSCTDGSRSLCFPPGNIPLLAFTAGRTANADDFAPVGQLRHFDPYACVCTIVYDLIRRILEGGYQLDRCRTWMRCNVFHDLIACRSHPFSHLWKSIKHVSQRTTLVLPSTRSSCHISEHLDGQCAQGFALTGSPPWPALLSVCAPP